MILADTSFWLALAIDKHAHHVKAAAWFDSVDRPKSVYFCRATQQSFLRLLTNAALQAAYDLEPLGNLMAWNFYDQLVSDDRVFFEANEPQQLEIHWKRLSAKMSASTKLWMDAYLAAFASSSGHQLVTLDRDFLQFPDLNVHLIQ